MFTKNKILTVHFVKHFLPTLFGIAIFVLVATLTSRSFVQAAPLNSFDVTYYNNINFTGNKISKVESSINHNWGTGSPNSRINPDTFSARYVGDFEFEEGTYEFTATADDGVRITVDNNIIIDAYYDQPPTTYTASTNLSAGSHSIKVEFYERSGGAVLIVGWEKVAGPTPPPPTPTPPPTPPSPTPTPPPDPNTENRISWNGQEWYLHGANMPWYNWSCDFGCNNNGGVSQASIKSEINTRFNQLDSANIHVVRWWMFPGNPWQITRSGNGTPTDINNAIYADIDAALDLAETHDLYYTFVLFSAPSDIPQSWLNDSTQRQALANTLQELFDHYENHPRIMTWEVFNEPEWDMWNGVVNSNNTVAAVTAIANAVHASSNKYVTVGSAMLDGLPFWTNTPVDYYDAHWYDYMSPGDWCAICTDYDEVKARYGLTKPLVIGEFYAGYDVDPNRFNYWYDNGYAGAYPWSLFPEKTNDGMQINMNAAGSFGNSKPDIGPQD